MKKYSNIDLYELIEADGIDYTILENIDIDEIDDKEVRRVCNDLKELMIELKDILDNANSNVFGIVEDDDDDDDDDYDD